LRKRGAYIEGYRQTDLFRDSLEEFDHSEEIVRSMIEEYAAAERSDYIEWGQEEQKLDDMDY
jgi:tubulin gamma